MLSILFLIYSAVSILRVRTVPSISAISGITSKTLPEEILPNDRTTGSNGSISLDVID